MIPHLIPIERLLVLVGWSIVVLWSLGSCRRAILGGADAADFKAFALALTGFAIDGFQLNAISGKLTPRTDYWTAALLGMLAIAAGVIVFMVFLPRAPEAHQRAVARTCVAIIAVCIIGGSLG